MFLYFPLYSGLAPLHSNATFTLVTPVQIPAAEQMRLLKDESPEKKRQKVSHVSHI